MRKRRTRRVARATVLAWVLVGGASEPLDAEPVARAARAPEASWTEVEGVAPPVADVAPPVADVVTTEVALPVASAVASTSGGCAATISCGVGCTATLASGFCSVTVKWQIGLGGGPLQIGPQLKIECQVCDCMYLEPGPAGNLLRRTVTFGCTSSLEGLTLQ